MKITGAEIYDPAKNVHGVTRDIFIHKGRIVESDPGDHCVIDARGGVAMAGAIDVHSHLLAVSRLARAACNESHPAQSVLESYASPRALAEEYLAQGITFFVEAGLTATQLEDMANSRLTLGMEYGALRLAGTSEGSSANESDEANENFLSIKYVGEKGLASFWADVRLKTEAPPHIHLPHLAEGEGISTIELLLGKLGEKRCHLSHLSHYAFEDFRGKLRPATKKAAKLLDKCRNVTFDLAPITFGRTLAFTVDEKLFDRIAKGNAESSVSRKNSPYRALPYTFKKESYMDSMLWIAGMELLLYIKDLSRACLSIDFPSGGGIAGSYPLIIACLMDKDKRDAVLKSLNRSAVSVSSLGSIAREYSLYEIATVTRSAPATVCKLAERGHLGAGALADVVIYEKSADIEKMFAAPRVVIKDGQVIH